MVNSKKMNKSTVAVIVLALLLVLSLILTATGAWFTDKANSEKSDSAATGFGEVKLAAIDQSAYKVGDWTKLGNDLLVPGSTLAVAGGDVTNAGTVDIYVKLGMTTEVTIAGNKYNLTDTVTKENGVEVEGKTLADYFAFGELATKAEAEEGSTAMYKLTVGSNLTVDGFDVEIKTALPNALTINGTDVTFNGNTEGVSVSVSVKVAAVQVANWDSVALAEAFLDTMLEA